MKQLAILASMWCAMAMGGAQVNADVLGRFRGDFKEESPAAGWEYLWNATGEIGQTEHYKPLVWNATAKQYTADATKIPQPAPAGYVNVGKSILHPGAGSSRTKDKLDRYVIASFTIPAGKSGNAWIAEGSIFRSAPENSEEYNGSIDLQVYLNDKRKSTQKFKTEDGVKRFDLELGEVKAGDKVIVAVGPDGNDIADRVMVDFCVSILPKGQKPKPTEAPVRPPADQPSVRGVAGQADERFLKAHELFLSKAKGSDAKLVFLGDSITAGWGSNGKDTWKTFAPYKPLNFGIGGDQTQHVLWRIANGEFDSIRPKVVVLMIGTNNSGVYTAPEIAKAIRTIIDAIRSKSTQTKVMLLGVFPRSAQPGEPLRVKIKAVNELIAKFDDGKSVRYLDLTDKFLEPDGSISKEIMYDYLHLTPAGYQRWGDAIRPLLEEMMK